MKAYHVNESKGNDFFIYATGPDQWLGNGFYFWQDIEFAHEWCKKYDCADLYEVELDLIFSKDDDVIDTVFNEKHYRFFVQQLEKWAMSFYKEFNKWPLLREFNNFIKQRKVALWSDIVAIKFQDTPTNDEKNYLKIKQLYYKKRIQIVVFDEDKITTFVKSQVKKSKP